MNNIPSDVLRDITAYLTDYEILLLSNTAKFDLEFNREKHKKNIIYKKLIPMLTLGPKNVLCWESRLDHDRLAARLFWGWSGKNKVGDVAQVEAFSIIHTLSDEFLKSWHYPIWEPGSNRVDSSIDRELNYLSTPHYLVNTFCTLTYPNEFYNGSKIFKKRRHYCEKKLPICMIYRCLLWSKNRSDIKKSLTLSALVG